MIQRSFQGRVLGWVVALGAALSLGLSSSAFAEVNASALVVRFRSPQTSLLRNDYSALINSRKGVVKMQFSTPEQAETARARLLSSPDVESVAPDFLYRPALHLQIRENQDPQTFYGLPFFDASMAETISDLPDVQLPSGNVTPGRDPLAAKDWALGDIDMPSVAAVNSIQGGQPPLIAAVIDTGVDYNHEDLIGAMWRDPSNPKIVGYDFAHDSDKPYDVRHFDIQGCLKDKSCISGATQEKYLTNPGHGTHCAGHVGAVANNSIGIRGVGGNVKIMALKFFYDYTDGANAGAGDDAAAIQSIDYAIAHGVKVISASWGGRMSPSDADASQLKAALLRAQKAGVLFVVAAGNDGIDNDTDAQPDYPAAYHFDNMIVVAASDSSDQLASFSNYGANTVDIAAPGVKILSTTVGSTYQDTIASFTFHGKHESMTWDGTSMATPIVAGAAALVWSKYPNETYRQIKERILNSARQVPGLAGKVASGGVLDVSAALGLSAQ